MIIQANSSVLTYKSSQVLDLMHPPSPDSDRQLYYDYNAFISAIDAIYATQNKDGHIPVFRTVSSSSDPDMLIPDSNSTLKFLIPGQSYLFIINSDSHLPLRIPNPIGLKDFVSYAPENTTYNDDSCCPVLSSEEVVVNLTPESGTFHRIRADIQNAISNEIYSYSISPVYSNWPAKLSPTSGEIVLASTANDLGKTSGHLEAVFSYYPSLTHDLSASIPYSLNKVVDSNYYTENIFSIINLSIFNSKCSVYDKNLILSCSSCIDPHNCPTVEMIASGNKDNNTKYIITTVKNLPDNSRFMYNFSTDSSNCTANITPLSGIIDSRNASYAMTPFNANDSAESESVMTKPSITIYSVFEHRDSLASVGNLLPTSSIVADPAVDTDLYTNLIFSLYPIGNNYCNPVYKKMLLECEKCFPSTDFKTTIKFDNPEYRTTFSSLLGPGFRYPSLFDDGVISTFNGLGITSDKAASINRRPNWEHNAYNSGLGEECCSKPINISLQITDAVSGEPYSYDFYSYPDITIIPRSGNLSFDEGSGSISVLAYLDGQRSSAVHVVLNHKKSNQKAFDGTVIRCPESWIVEEDV
jgi:hypothetical protein